MDNISALSRQRYFIDPIKDIPELYIYRQFQGDLYFRDVKESQLC